MKHLFSRFYLSGCISVGLDSPDYDYDYNQKTEGILLNASLLFDCKILSFSIGYNYDLSNIFGNYYCIGIGINIGTGRNLLN